MTSHDLPMEEVRRILEADRKQREFMCAPLLTRDDAVRILSEPRLHVDRMPWFRMDVGV